MDEVFDGEEGRIDPEAVVEVAVVAKDGGAEVIVELSV